MRYFLDIRAALLAALLAALPAVFALLVCASLAWAHPDPQAHARQLGDRIATSDEPAEQLHLRRGILHAKSQRWKAAIADFDQALLHDPTLDEARLRRADALHSGGCFEQAVFDAETFLGDHPNHVQALVVWARATDRLGEPKRALFAFDDALSQIERPSPSLLLERARLALRADPNDVDGALAGLDRGMQRVGQVSTLVLEAVELERRAARPAQALGRLDQLLEQGAPNPRWMLLKGELLEDIESPDLAKDAYLRALASIAKRPPSRRSTEAMRRLRTNLSKRLEHLATKSTAGEP